MSSLPTEKYWTYQDLFSLPDERKRYEIIAGELYEMPAPNTDHGAAIVRLMLDILGPLSRQLDAMLFVAPVDVFLADGDPVQPDLLVLLPENHHLVSKRGIEGPPDLIVEVLSPGNRYHDLVTKRALYARAGVREYWIVDLEQRRVEILVLRGATYQTLLVATGNTTLTSEVLPLLAARADMIFG